MASQQLKEVFPVADTDVAYQLFILIFFLTGKIWIIFRIPTHSEKTQYARFSSVGENFVPQL